MTRRLFPASLAAFGRLIAGAPKAPLAIIVHPSNRFDELSRTKITYLFHRNVSRWPWGAEAEPIDLPPGAPVRDAFLQAVLRRSEFQEVEFWMEQRTSRGVSPPPVARDAADVLRRVAAKPGAIGYVMPEDVTPNVKILRVAS